MNFAVFENHPDHMKVEIKACHTNWFSHGVFCESFLYEMLISYRCVQVFSLKSFSL